MTENDKLGALYKYLKERSSLKVGRRFVKPKAISFWMLSWGDLIDIREAFVAGDIGKVIEKVYGVSSRDLGRVKEIDILGVQKWILGRLNEVIEVENVRFRVSQANPQGFRADFKTFEYQLDELSGSDVLKYEELLKKPYVVIFKQLCINHERRMNEQNYIKNMNKNVSRKV